MSGRAVGFEGPWGAKMSHAIRGYHKGLLWASGGHAKLCGSQEAAGGCWGPLGAAEAQLFTTEILYIVFTHSYVVAYSFVFALTLVTGVTRGPCPIGWLHGSVEN
jgi:hypothetical protein